jgi:cell division protein ZapA
METTSDKQSVRVTILSRSFTLRTAGNPADVVKLASSVDELMLAIASKAPNADSTHIAVLACLHLADRLRDLESELVDLKTRVDRKSTQFAGMLEELIASAAERTAGES